MEGEGIDFLQFAFRWVNCLLIREVPFAAALRLWDTYLAEGPHFNEFLVSSADGGDITEVVLSADNNAYSGVFCGLGEVLQTKWVLPAIQDVQEVSI